ncbi:colony stimulating factor 2 receptor subunit alpha [Rhinolophus ferrumequinum]|uniref:Colony stimulating factor 2 receptor subunit alpha n=1 Tax=Rhinolophus ferrumequinum TaxID=59479 RepID=A0A7J8AUF1_RHIFE|nr:colony stimulating factor 2 receptor subunit alpha [Rhinolophus ferrumequinum]
MASLLDFVSLLMLLSSACTEEPDPAQENVSPVINMKLDPRKKMLTWNNRRNVTWQECKIDTPPSSPTRLIPQVKDNDTYFCIFPNCVLHRGALLTINVTVDGDVFQHELAFHNSGKEGSRAINFSCLIYNIRFMNCSWMPGPAAPADVQYHLYAWTSMYEDDEVECPHYLFGSTGTHVGCHFDTLAEPKSTDNYFFLVNGTSQETAIQFLDFTPFKATEMEKYNPPANLTVSYNGSHHVVRWDNPETRFDISSHILCYELDFQIKGSSSKRDPVFQRGSDKNVYLIPSSAARAENTFRVRVKYAYKDLWSDWSGTLHFGLPEPDFRGPPVALVGLVVGAAALLITVLMFLCTRFSLRQKLFPPVPQVKREVTGMFVFLPEVSWDNDHPPPGSQEPEDILMVEETPSSASGQAEMGSAPHGSKNVPPEGRALAV